MPQKSAALAGECRNLRHDRSQRDSYDGSMVSPTFVVSSGRCGSTLISNLIRMHPEILSLSGLFATLQTQPLPSGEISGLEFWDVLSKPRPAYTAMLQSEASIGEFLYRLSPASRFTRETGVPPLLLIALPHLTDDAEGLFDELAGWAPTLDVQPIGDHFKQLFQWLCQRFGRLAPVERSGSSLAWLSVLRGMFPTAKFVHLFRDGRDCALSMSRHEGFRRSLAEGLMPGGLPGPSEGQRSTPETIPLEVFGRSWSQMVVRGCRQLAQLPEDRVMQLSYEALIESPARELRRLCQFIGISQDPVWLATASQIPKAKKAGRPAMSEAQQRRLDSACAEGMRLLYGVQR
jgi:hypothetical protein